MVQLRCQDFKIIATKPQINLDINLFNGQSFRWKKFEECHVGVLGQDIWRLKQENSSINCSIFFTDSNNSQLKLVDKFKDYFRMNEEIEQHFSTWAAKDPHILALLKTYSGLRILRQDPIENIFSFICSSNNNIARISQMVHKLCTNYGLKIGEVEGIAHYTFPTCERLAEPGVEGELRKLGFGYRAKYINQAARYIMRREEEFKQTQKTLKLSAPSLTWLQTLRRNANYEEVRAEVMKIPGVGPKVADCICLMSLDKLNAVPVDTHVWQVAKRNYLPHLPNTKSLTFKLYKTIGDHFRELYGAYAGWAHSYLFTSDLAVFSKSKTTTTKKRKSQDP